MQIAKPSPDRAANAADKGTDEQRQGAETGKRDSYLSCRVYRLRCCWHVDGCRGKVRQCHRRDRDEGHQHGRGCPGQEAVGGITKENLIAV